MTGERKRETAQTHIKALKPSVKIHLAKKPSTLVRLHNDQDLIVNVKTGDTNGEVRGLSIQTEIQIKLCKEQYIIQMKTINILLIKFWDISKSSSQDVSIIISHICIWYLWNILMTVFLLWPHDVTSQTSLVELVEWSYSLMAACCSLIFYSVPFLWQTYSLFIYYSIITIEGKSVWLPSLVYMTSFIWS